MSIVTAPSQSDWSTNVYTLTITRILIVFGVTYLVRSIVSYFFQTLPSATRVPSIDVENIGLEDVDVMADVLSITSPSPNIGTDVNLDLELGLQRPRRSYNPRDGPRRSRTEGHEGPQASAVSSSTTVPIRALDQDTIVHNRRTNNDEDSAEDAVTQDSMPLTAGVFVEEPK